MDRGLWCWTALLVSAVLMTGCDALKSKVTGTAQASGGKMGAYTLAPQSCQSGEHYGFFGVDMFVPAVSNTRLRYVEDATVGRWVWLAYPNSDKEGIKYSAPACKVLDGEVRRTNTKINGYWAVEGHIEFDCAGSDREHVGGSLQFSNCH